MFLKLTWKWPWLGGARGQEGQCDLQHGPNPAVAQLGLCLATSLRRPVVSWQQVKEPGEGWRKEAFLLQKEETAALSSWHHTASPRRLVG